MKYLNKVNFLKVEDKIFQLKKEIKIIKILKNKINLYKLKKIKKIKIHI